jgi:electron transfer flavoprotein beta subunit
MGAKRKEIKELKAADVGVSIGDGALRVVALENLPTRPPGRMINGEPATAVEELVRLLREEAKAI